MKRALLWVAVGVIGAAALGEIGLRLAGVGDFPTYDANPVTGYIPSANQSGRFMGRDWAFNEHHMGVAQPFEPSAKRDIVLVGDSIVYGGNPYRQADKLGPVMERSMPGSEVWPIGAGSWALRNELAYLAANPDVIRGADAFVFVLNSGDFQEPSVWVTDATHPRRRPVLIAPYLVQRKLPYERRSSSTQIGKNSGQSVPASLHSRPQRGRPLPPHKYEWSRFWMLQDGAPPFTATGYTRHLPEWRLWLMPRG